MMVLEVTVFVVAVFVVVVNLAKLEADEVAIAAVPSPTVVVEPSEIIP